MRVFTESYVKELVSKFKPVYIKKFADANESNLSDEDLQFAKQFEIARLNSKRFWRFDYKKFCMTLELQTEFVKFCVEFDLQLAYTHKDGDLDQKDNLELLMVKNFQDKTQLFNRHSKSLTKHELEVLAQGAKLLKDLLPLYKRKEDFLWHSHWAIRKEYETPQMMVKKYMANLKANQPIEAIKPMFVTEQPDSNLRLRKCNAFNNFSAFFDLKSVQSQSKSAKPIPTNSTHALQLN